MCNYGNSHVYLGLKHFNFKSVEGVEEMWFLFDPIHVTDLIHGHFSPAQLHTPQNPTPEKTLKHSVRISYCEEELKQRKKEICEIHHQPLSVLLYISEMGSTNQQPESKPLSVWQVFVARLTSFTE